MRIQTRLSAIVFLTVLVTGFAVAIASGFFSRNLIAKQIHSRLKISVYAREHSIELLLREYGEIVGTMATGNPFVDAVNPAARHTQSMTDVNRMIQSAVQYCNDISRIRVVNKDGVVIASSHGDVGWDEILWKRQKEAYIAEFHVSRFTSNFVLSVAAPIFVNGEFSGTVIVNFDAEKALFKIVTDRMGLGESGEVYLVNKAGYMISPSRFQNNAVLRQKVDVQRIKAFDECAHAHGAETHKHEAFQFRDYLGREALGVCGYIPEMGWWIVADMDLSEAFAPIARLIQMSLVILVVVSIAGLVLCIPLSRALTKPIVELHRGAEEIARGNLDYKVGTKAADEVGQLSMAFDTMADRVKQYRTRLEQYSAGLEETVKERTAQLEEKVRESEDQRMATFNLLEDVSKTKIALEKEVRERRLAQEELTRLATAIDQASEIIVITDAEATIQYVNPAFERITGYSREEAVGENPRILKSGKQDDAFYRDMWDALTCGETWHGNSPTRRKTARFT